MLARLIIIASLLPSAWVVASDCNVQPDEETILRFAFDHQVISKSDETDNFGVLTKWRVAKSKSAAEGCVHVLELCIEMDGQKFCEAEGPFDAVASKNGNLLKFEDLVAVPDRLNVAFGVQSYSRVDTNTGMSCRTTALPEDLYYAEITGASVLEVMKSVHGQIPYSGFWANLSATNVTTDPTTGITTGTPDGKLPFDPTAGRTWKVKEAGFSLRRGMTPEIHDVRAIHLDENFQAYFSGSGQKVAPWVAGSVRAIQEGMEWKPIHQPISPKEADLPLCEK